MNHLTGKSWIITHGVSGGYLTYETIKENKKLGIIDECHYTSDAAVVYTYLHFVFPVTLKMISSFMDVMKRERNMILFEIFGYDPIAVHGGGYDLSEHIGFKILMSHYQTRTPQFQSCTNGKPGVIKGMLWDYDSVPRIQEALKLKSGLLEGFFIRMKKELDEFKQRAEMVDTIHSQLMAREAKIEELRGMVKDLRHYELVAHVLKYRIQSIDKEIQDILLAPDHLGRPI